MNTEDFEVVRWVVRVKTEEPGKRKIAELIGFDAKGNEYRLRQQVYVIGEYCDVDTDIICTQPDL